MGSATSPARGFPLIPFASRFGLSPIPILSEHKKTTAVGGFLVLRRLEAVRNFYLQKVIQPLYPEDSYFHNMGASFTGDRFFPTQLDRSMFSHILVNSLAERWLLSFTFI